MKPGLRIFQATGICALLVLAKTAVCDVTINGLAHTAEENVRLTLSLEKEPCDAPEWKIKRLFDKAEQEIDQALRAIGHYHASSRKRLGFNTTCWHAEFNVDTGPPVLIEHIDIVLQGDAEQDPAFQTLVEAFKKTNGNVLHHGEYEKMKSRIEALAWARGYFDSRFLEKTLLVDKDNNSARIRLVFDGGPRSSFGAIDIDQEILSPDFVAKFIGIKSGDPYNSETLATTHDALARSGYFDRIDLQPQMEKIENLAVPISLKLQPKKTHHYSVGAGFDTDKGPLLAGAYQNRRLNEDGDFLTADIDLSPVLSTADLEYNVPLAQPLTDFFSFGAGAKREDTDSYQSLSGKLSARLKHSFDNGWKQTLFLDQVYESFTAANEDRDALLLLPGGSWLRSVADDPMRPTKGYRLEFNITGTYQNPLSNVSLLQGSMAAVWSHPMPWDDGRLILRAEQGATLVDQFDQLPTSYRFYAGGMNSVRGYAYKELGPKDANGLVVGGRFLSVLSVEYEQRFWQDWGVATFIDSGNAYDLEDIKIKTGVGLGVRWYSPIGPIRVDVAVPMDESDSSFQFHFAAGTRL